MKPPSSQPLKSLHLSLCACLGAVVFLAGCGAESPTAATPQAVAVGVYQVEPQPFEMTTDLPGRTVAYRLAEVRPQVNGIIEKRLFTEGANVVAGQQLYQIDDDKYQAIYKRTLANLRKAERLKSRYRELLESNSVSRQLYDDALSNWELAEAEADLALIDVHYTSVVAPVTGRIGRSAISEGALVTNGQTQPLATIQQIDPIYVDILQPVSELLRLQQAMQEGQLQRKDDDTAKIILRLEDGSRYAHEGSLRFSEVSVDQSTGSVTLRAVFPNPDWLLLPGMFVHGRLSLGFNDNALLVPQQAVQRDATGKPAVWVVNDDNTADLRSIETERTVGNMWLVKRGLEGGERVITEGLLQLRPGVSVTPSAASNIKPVLEFAPTGH